MKTKLIAFAAGVLLTVVLAATAVADIGTVVWKMHCPANASIMPYDALDGGVDIVCMYVLRTGK